MKVAILQSNYIPWRGYFDLIDDVDQFIFYDDVQYTKSDWRNRNKIKTQRGTAWLTIPVRRNGLGTTIEQASIDETRDWRRSHLDAVTQNYRSAPYFEWCFSYYERALLNSSDSLSNLNVDLIKRMCGLLGIATLFSRSSDFEASGERTARLISLLQKVGATTYLSGPAAKAYLDEVAFLDAGIALQYKSYRYEPYPQIGGDFENQVSVLDLLMNIGPQSRNHLKSTEPNILANV